jgi:hypothetical protein
MDTVVQVTGSTNTGRASASAIAVGMTTRRDRPATVTRPVARAPTRTAGQGNWNRVDGDSGPSVNTGVASTAAAGAAAIAGPEVVVGARSAEVVAGAGESGTEAGAAVVGGDVVAGSVVPSPILMPTRRAAAPIAWLAEDKSE